MEKNRDYLDSLLNLSSPLPSLANFINAFCIFKLFKFEFCRYASINIVPSSLLPLKSELWRFAHIKFVLFILQFINRQSFISAYMNNVSVKSGLNVRFFNRNSLNSDIFSLLSISIYSLFILSSIFLNVNYGNINIT